MLKPRYEPSAEIVDWTTYNRAIVAKGRLVSQKGLVAEIGEIGAALVSLRLPSDEGEAGGGDALVWEFDHPAHYLFSDGAVGGVIGPVANRLADGVFDLGGAAFKLDTKESGNLLHSGSKSTLYRFWELSVVDGGILATLNLSNKADGFPGQKTYTAFYRFNEDGDALELSLAMTTTRNTLANMTHHPYWNLGGGEALSGHLLEIPAQNRLKTNEDLLPTGELGTWEDYPSNFSRPSSLDLAKSSYDDHFVLPAQRAFNARLTYPRLGRSLTIESDKAGVQLYTRAGGTLPAPTKDVGPVEGLPEAVCLEPQLHPDAPNHEGFPSILLKKNETYTHNIVYRLAW